MRIWRTVAVAALTLAAACGNGNEQPTQRTFDEQGFDEHGCNPGEEFDSGSGLCEPGECLTEAHERMDRAGPDDVDAYNDAVEDANACNAVP